MNENPYASPMAAADSKPVAAAKLPQKLPPSAYFLCGWPLLLLLVGGAVDGALGGAAFGINLAIYRSSMPLPAKLILNPLIGLVAALIWFAFVVLALNLRG